MFHLASPSWGLCSTPPFKELEARLWTRLSTRKYPHISKTCYVRRRHILCKDLIAVNRISNCWQMQNCFLIDGDIIKAHSIDIEENFNNIIIRVSNFTLFKILIIKIIHFAMRCHDNQIFLVGDIKIKPPLYSLENDRKFLVLWPQPQQMKLLQRNNENKFDFILSDCIQRIIYPSMIKQDTLSRNWGRLRHSIRVARHLAE